MYHPVWHLKFVGRSNFHYVGNVMPARRTKIPPKTFRYTIQHTVGYNAKIHTIEILGHTSQWIDSAEGDGLFEICDHNERTLFCIPSSNFISCVVKAALPRKRRVTLTAVTELKVAK